MEGNELLCKKIMPSILYFLSEQIASENYELLYIEVGNNPFVPIEQYCWKCNYPPHLNQNKTGAQQTEDVDPMWPTVCSVGPALNHHRLNVSYTYGILCIQQDTS